MPTSSITYIRPTTSGGSVRREVGREREADGLGHVQAGADHQEGEPRPRPPDPDRRVRAARQQEQRKRHDRQAAELDQRPLPDVRHALPAQLGAVLSERKPISARNGANSSGSEIMIPTSDAGTSSSTIITRFSVPISSTRDMPTDT